MASLGTAYDVIDGILQRIKDATYATVLLADFQPQLESLRRAMRQAEDIRERVDAQDAESITGALDLLSSTLDSASEAVARLPTASSTIDDIQWYFCGSDIKDELLRQSVRLDQQLNQLGTLTSQAAIRAQLPPPAIEPVDVDARHEERKERVEQLRAEGAGASGGEPTGTELALQRFQEEHGDLLTEAQQTVATRRREVRMAVEMLALLARAFDALQAKAAKLETEKQDAGGKLEKWRQSLSGARAGLATLQEDPEMWEMLKDSPDATKYLARIDKSEFHVTRYAEKLREIEVDIRNPRVLLPAWSDDGFQQEIPVTLDDALRGARNMGAIMGPESWAGGAGRNLVQDRIARLREQQDEDEGRVLRMIANGNGSGDGNGNGNGNGNGAAGGLTYEDIVRAVREGTEELKGDVKRARADVFRTLGAVNEMAEGVHPTESDELPPAGASADGSDPPTPPPGQPARRASVDANDEAPAAGAAEDGDAAAGASA